MDELSPSVRFGELARIVANEARRLGLTVPVFKSPPRVPDVNRTIRRGPGDRVVVAVRFRDRPWDDVAEDLVAGIEATTPTTFDDTAAFHELRTAVAAQRARCTVLSQID